MSLAASAQALARLEPFLLLAKSAKGAAAAQLIAEATAAAGCYVFAELFDYDGITALANDQQHANSFRTLELFAYGTYSDYVNAEKGTFTDLNDLQVEKLRQLTLIACASRQRSLAYDDLLNVLGLAVHVGSLTQPGPSRVSKSSAIRRLEDVIIESVYAGIISARLDQARSRVDIESVMGRDVRGDESLEQLSIALKEWHNTTADVMKQLQSHIDDVRLQDNVKSKNRRDLDAKMEQTLMQLLSKTRNPNDQSASRSTISYDRLGTDRLNGPPDVEMDEDPAGLRKKKSTSGSSGRSKRTRA